jgi:hypothetical protein
MARHWEVEIVLAFRQHNKSTALIVPLLFDERNLQRTKTKYIFTFLEMVTTIISASKKGHLGGLLRGTKFCGL